ncbi:MAG: PAS domain S-box protein [Syntrophorhabdaceae bacterium]
MYENDEDRSDFLTSFIRQGLNKNEKVVYYGDEAGLHDREIRQIDAPGCFVARNAGKVIYEDLIKDISGSAQGAPGTRIAIDGPSGHPLHFAVEILKSAMHDRCMAVVVYGLAELTPEFLLDILAVYSSFIIGGEVYENFLFRAPSGVSGKRSLKIQGILDLMRDHKKLKEELKKGDEALRASEHNYLSIFESAANLIATVDKKGKIIDCNGKIKEVLGYDRDEIIGKSIAAVFHPGHLHKAYEILKEVIKKGASYNKQYQMLGKDGSCIFVNINSTPLKNEKGKVAKVISIVEDITERKRVEEALFQSEKRYRELIDVLPDAIVSLSHGRIIYANLAAYSILGLTHPREFIGHPIQEFLDPAAITHFRQYLETDCRPDKNSGPVKVKTLRPDGETVFIEWTSIALNHSEGHIAMFMGRDITGKENAENRIRESEERYRIALEHSKELEKKIRNSGKISP